jgi:Hemerythrin HHE cation binding domain
MRSSSRFPHHASKRCITRAASPPQRTRAAEITARASFDESTDGLRKRASIALAHVCAGRLVVDPASRLYRSRSMPADFMELLRRDHSDLQDELTQLLDPTATIAQLRSSLDGVRLGLTAHAEAEDIVLAKFELVPELAVLVAQMHAAHLAQEGALSALVTARPGTAIWRECAQHLRELVFHHAHHEETVLLPAIAQHAHPDDLAHLAGDFATERLRQLAMLQPSAPVFMPFVVEERAS